LIIDCGSVPMPCSGQSPATMKMKKLVFMLAVCGAYNINAAALNTAKIDQITGLKGKLSEAEGVYKITFPRSDVKVAIDGWPIPPFMGLGTWAAFEGTNEKAVMMGDTVLFEDEVNPVMSAALDNGLSVTALHNHFFFDEPKVYFMHIEGQDRVENLAAAVRKVYDKIKQIRATDPKPKSTFAQKSLDEKSSITPGPLNEVFDIPGEAKEGMMKFTIGKQSKMHGFDIAKEMGVNTWAAFAGTDDNAVVDGDFAVEEDQLQTALKALRRSGINIVAIHSHMTAENPRILFFHYWGRGPARELARSLKDALMVTGLLGVSTEARN
jgi:Domain of Unknown Function (DUF1259)